MGAYGTTAYGAGGYGTPQATPPQSNKPKPWVWMVILVVVLAIAAGAIYLANRPGSGPTPTPTPTRERINLAQVGDCFDRQTMIDDQYTYIRTLDCNTPHDSEVVFVGPVDSTTYPDDDEWDAFVDDLCSPAFESYIGQSYDYSVLRMPYVVPSETGWNKGDHTLICFAYDDDGPVSTPMKGSGR